jgi:hypothetical protein
MSRTTSRLAAERIAPAAGRSAVRAPIPYCGEAYPILKEVKKRICNNLRFVFRNFPLSEMHPNAFAAAEAAEAAGVQGKFWEMHDMRYQRRVQIFKLLTQFHVVRRGKHGANDDSDIPVDKVWQHHAIAKVAKRTCPTERRTIRRRSFFRSCQGIVTEA